MNTVEEFEKIVIDEKKPSMLCFIANWCAPSINQIKAIEEIKTKYEEKFLIEIIDIEKASELAKTLKINNFPTTLFFVDGELQEQNCLYGYQDTTMLIDSFECTLWEMENKSSANKYIWWVIGALAIIAVILLVYVH